MHNTQSESLKVKKNFSVVLCLLYYEEKQRKLQKKSAFCAVNEENELKK